MTYDVRWGRDAWRSSILLSTASQALRAVRGVQEAGQYDVAVFHGAAGDVTIDELEAAAESEGSTYDRERSRAIYLI
jgi:hypothetical protein